jgi:hypothetical protein
VPNTDWTISVVISEENFSWCICSIHYKNLRMRQKEDNKLQISQDWIVLLIDYRNHQENGWFILHSQRIGLYSEHYLKKKYCPYLHTRQLWFTYDTGREEWVIFLASIFECICYLSRAILI